MSCHPWAIACFSRAVAAIPKSSAATSSTCSTASKLSGVRPCRATPLIAGEPFEVGRGGSSSAYVAVYVVALAGAVMLCVAAPPSDHEARWKVFPPSTCVAGALTDVCEPTISVRANGAIPLALPMVSVSPAGTVRNVSGTIRGSSVTLAALVTRGLAEIGRIVRASGGQERTIAGLAGIGNERFERGKLSGVGTPGGDCVTQIGKGDGRGSGFGACRRAIDGGGKLREGRFELGNSLIERGELRGEVRRVAGEMRFGQRAELCLERLDFFLQIFEVRRAFALLGGKRAVDLALQPLLEIADLCVERSRVGHRAAFLGRLGQGIDRLLEARHARGQIGEVWRRLDLAVFQGLDLEVRDALETSPLTPLPMGKGNINFVKIFSMLQRSIKACCHSSKVSS